MLGMHGVSCIVDRFPRGHDLKRDTGKVTYCCGSVNGCPSLVDGVCRPR